MYKTQIIGRLFIWKKRATETLINLILEQVLSQLEPLSNTNADIKPFLC